MSWPYESYEAVNDYRWMTWPDQVINDHNYNSHNNEYQHQHQHLFGHTNSEQAPGYFAANHYASYRSLHHYPALDSGHMRSSFSSASTSPTSSSGNSTYSAPPAWHSGDPACMIYQSGTPSPVDCSSHAAWMESPTAVDEHETLTSDDTPLAHDFAAHLPADLDFKLTLESCTSRADPSHDDEDPDLPKPRRQDPRWDGDEYAARWVRGEGIARTGFCGICSTWYVPPSTQQLVQSISQNTHTNTSRFFLSFCTLQAQAQRLRLLVPHALHTRHQLRNRKILLCSTSRTKCSGRSRLRCPLQQLRPMGLCRPSGPLAHSLLSPRIQMPDQQQQSASCLLPIISK